MSGFEPFLLEAGAAEAGTAALASEVMAPELLGSLGTEFGTEAAFSGLGGLEGLTGLAGEGLGGISSLMGGVESAAPTLAQNLATAAPEALGQTQSAILNAQAGANQMAFNPMSQAQIAEMTGGIPTAGPGVNVADATSGLSNVSPETLAPGESVVPQGVDRFPQQAMTGEGWTQAAAPETTSMIQAGASPTGGGIMDALKSMGSKASDWWDKQSPEKKLLYGSAAGLGVSSLLGKKSDVPDNKPYSGPLSKFKYDPSRYTPYTPAPPTPYKPVYKDYRMAAGGNVQLQGHVSLDEPSGGQFGQSGFGQQGANGYQPAGLGGGLDQNAIQANPQGFQQFMQGAQQREQQMPGSTFLGQLGAAGLGAMRFAHGGIADLGSYSDGGRMLKGPGDGMSDNIPAMIAGKQPARLANEEFVVPADVVSHLGNGSSDAGAKQLYQMMDRVRQARTGQKKQGKQIKADKYLPA